MPPRGAASARRDAEKKRGTLGDDANLGQAAVTRVRELLDRRGAGSRGARGGSGSATSSRRGAAGAAFGGGARVPSATAADESAKPKRAAKKKASAHNAKILAAASVAADLATNSGKANRQTHLSGNNSERTTFDTTVRYDRSRTAKTRLEDAAGTCGAAAAGTSASLDRAAVAAVEADAHVAAVAAAAERKFGNGQTVSLVSVSSSDEDTSGDEWEDVGGDFDAYAPITEEEEDETLETLDRGIEGIGKKSRDGGNNAPRRRVSPADREALRAMHRTHLLCSLARAAATDAAASDPLVRACAASAAPRGVALETDARTERARGAAARDGELVSFLPTADRVARLAKWFAGAFECRAFSKPARFSKNPFFPGANAGERKRRRTDRNLEPLSRPARVEAVDDVIVLDDDDDDDATRNRPNFPSIPSNASAHETPWKRDTNVNVTTGSMTQRMRQKSQTLSSHLADACVSAQTASPRLRLAFACARRRGTQEDLVGVFVAAARGLGLTARVVAAFDPTPHRASASELARLGVRVGDEPTSPRRAGVEGTDAVRGNGKTVRRRKRKDPSETSSVPGPGTGFEGPGPAERFNSVRCDPSFFARETRTSDDDTNAEALARERVTWWAEVLCADETEPSDETAVSENSKNARWVPVAPHAAGVSKSAPRWSFRAGAALVDDARALRGASPYVFAFGDVGDVGDVDVDDAPAEDENDASFNVAKGLNASFARRTSRENTRRRFRGAPRSAPTSNGSQRRRGSSSRIAVAMRTRSSLARTRGTRGRWRRARRRSACRPPCTSSRTTPCTRASGFCARTR
jgi:hypothetical protein